MLSKYRIKRTGKNDENDLKFFYGNIHGLENLAYLDDQML